MFGIQCCDQFETSGFDVELASQYGNADFDWSNARALWANQHPMDDNGLLLEQAAMVKARSPSTHVWIYRNLVKALSWYKDVGEKLADPQYVTWPHRSSSGISLSLSLSSSVYQARFSPIPPGLSSAAMSDSFSLAFCCWPLRACARVSQSRALSHSHTPSLQPTPLTHSIAGTAAGSFTSGRAVQSAFRTVPTTPRPALQQNARCCSTPRTRRRRTPSAARSAWARIATVAPCPAASVSGTTATRRCGSG